MNYPASPQGYPQQAPPAAPGAQYPPQQQFAPQYPQAPAPQQGYPQGIPVTPPAPQYPGYPAAPAQGYAPPQYPAPAPVANATIADFYNQPSSGMGPSLGWKTKQGLDKPNGSWFAGVVARDVTNGDIDQQTNTQGVPQTFRDGRPKLQMKVGLKDLQTSDGGVDHPDGEGTWYVKGLGQTELTRAMAEAGLPHGTTPKAGDYVVVVLVGRRPNGAGFNPSNVVQITYTPASGHAPATTAPAVAQPVQQAPVQAPAPVAAPVAPPAAPAPVAATQAPLAPAPVPAAPVAQVPQQASVAPPQAPPAPPAPPANLDPAAAEILAGLTAPAQG